MQLLQDIPDTTSLTASRAPLLNNILTALSNSSGTVFPTTNLQIGMSCFRTDLNKIYILKDLTPTWVLNYDLLRVAAYTDSPTFTGTVTAPTFSGALNGTAANVTTNANMVGDVTSVGNTTTLTNAPVIAKVLTGYVSEAGVIAATDSILAAIQKLNGNDAASFFPVGTRMLFNQTAAPTGWTKDTNAALDDSTLRIVAGSVGSGGSVALSTAAYTPVISHTIAVSATTLSIAQIPSHNHPGITHLGAVYVQSDGLYPPAEVAGNSGGASYNNFTSAQGDGGSHTHGIVGGATSSAITLGLKYNDVIIASKN